MTDGSTVHATLAQLTDLHLGPIRGYTPRYWSLKRTTGLVNWHRSRKHDLSSVVLARITRDLASHAPDHVAVTGDLVNLGLPAGDRCSNALAVINRASRDCQRDPGQP